MAAGKHDSERTRTALATLCTAYWYPLYTFIRRQGNGSHDSEDLTQAFFAWLLQSDYLRGADPSRGRFRSFLLATLKHFLSDERKKARAQKRGGGLRPTPLELDTAETRYGYEPATNLTPEKCYERRWALTLLERCPA